MNSIHLSAIVALSLFAAAPSSAIEGTDQRPSPLAEINEMHDARNLFAGGSANRQSPRPGRAADSAIAQLDLGAVYSDEAVIQDRGGTFKLLQETATEKICSWQTNSYGNGFLESGFCAVDQEPAGHSMCACATPNGPRLGRVLTKPVGTGELPAVR